ncbi:MAG: aminopeptidase [Pseudomonadota bacterium]
MKRFVLLFVVLVLAQGCTSVRYYSQVTRGHLDLMSRRVPIDDLLADPTVDAQLKTRLSQVLDARAFAVSELRLPDNGSYRSYADLERPFVVWNVFATPEFSVVPTTWCYWFVGCLGYRGYYAEADAERERRRLTEQGYDAFVGGVAAYSTLGRFDDPVLNTMLRRGDTELAGLLFHELTHQVVYRVGDSEFSESLASFVQMEGVRRWLLRTGNTELIDVYRQAEVRNTQFVELVSRTRTVLADIYAREWPPAQMREAKVRAFESLKNDYRTLKAQWGGYAGYDGWFDRPLNNAHVASVATYNRFVPAFAQVLRESNNDFDAFFRRCAELEKMDAEPLARELERLMSQAAQYEGSAP